MHTVKYTFYRSAHLATPISLSLVGASTLLRLLDNATAVLNLIMMLWNKHKFMIGFKHLKMVKMAATDDESDCRSL